MAKSTSMRKRAITIYLATDEEKQAFVKRCDAMGLTVSFVAGLCYYRGLETGIMDQLREVTPDRTSVQKAATVVKSKSLISRTARRPSAKKP